MMKKSDAGEAPRQSNCKITKPCHIIQIRRIEITTKSGVHISSPKFLPNLLPIYLIPPVKTDYMTNLRGMS